MTPSALADAYPALPAAPAEGPVEVSSLPLATSYLLPPPTATLDEVRQYILNSTLVEWNRPPTTLSADEFFAAGYNITLKPIEHYFPPGCPSYLNPPPSIQPPPTLQPLRRPPTPWLTS